MMVLLTLYGGRLIQLQGLDWPHYQTLAQQQRLTTASIPTVRGSITTSDGTVLAMTVQTDTVFADPAEVPAGSQARAAGALAGLLSMPAATIISLVDHPTSPQYVVLKRGVSAATAGAIHKLGLPGIAMTPSYTTSYPNGDLAANLIGFTDVNAHGDLHGEAGLEQEYNSLLAGRDGSEEVEVGTTGHPIPLTVQDLRAPVPARSLRLTIQADIQYEAQQQCALRVAQTHAASCSIVVMRPDGQILALAQAPEFNPADPSSLQATTDIPVADVFAPGSTLKPVTVAAALERGHQTPMSTYTVPDQIQIGPYTFNDAEPHPTARYTIAGILAYSLNDGMVQVAQKITPEQQYQYLRRFGLGSVTGLGLPGESAGIVHAPGTADYWGDERYEMSFGQGIGVTAVQMASMYATIANGGVRVQPTIVAGSTNSAGKYSPARRPQGRRVIQRKTARELISMMQQVPSVDAGADEPWGLIAGYSVAAKTGTAELPDAKLGNCLCEFGSSYIGIAPAKHPQLIVAVNVQDPTKNGYYGDQVAGPVFYNVMKFALQTMKIPPDGGKAPRLRLIVPG
jgi:cell division protein FtsI (penicillin-binding protein 3)